MPRKVVLINDPGIDGAVAIVLALEDPDIDVLGVAATAGNVDAAQATQNVHAIIEQLDPPRLPRIGAALPAEYGIDGKRLHGANGLGNAALPSPRLHHPHPSDKVLVDLIRQAPHEVSVIVMGPLTVLARALDRDPELPQIVHRIVCVGGTWHEAGNASPVAEFHFFCDPPSARQVVRSGAPITLVSLDVSQKLVLSPRDLMEVPSPNSRSCRLLQQIVPFGIGATSNFYGVEGFHLKDVLGIIAVGLPSALSTRSMYIDVETKGELTRGMMVVDGRPLPEGSPNVDLAVGVDTVAVKDYILRTLARTK
jgi:inosine-uridine nucleoside N-ribohydrolase